MPLRSYSYLGSITSWIYLPILLLFGSPLTARLLNMVYLLCGGLLAARFCKLSPIAVVSGLLLFFPYVFMHLVDTGPVSPQIFLVFALVVLLELWIKKLKFRHVFTIALLAFLGIWIKFSFLWYFPAFVVLLIYFACKEGVFAEKNRLMNFLRQLILLVCTTSLLLSALLFSTNPDPLSPMRYPYLDALLHTEQYAPRKDSEWYWGFRGPGKAFLSPLEATQRVYMQTSADTPGSLLYPAFVYLFVPITILVIFFVNRRKRGYLLAPAVYYVAFLVTTAFILTTPSATGMHHAILAYPFLVLSSLSVIAVLLKDLATTDWLRTYFFACVSVFIILNAMLFAKLSYLEYRKDTDPSRMLIRAIIRDDDLASRYAMFFPDWGMYYYAAVFGSREAKMQFSMFAPTRTMPEWRNIAAHEGRKVMVIGQFAEFYASDITLERCAALPANAAWQIFAEPDPIFRAACDRFAWATDHGTRLTRHPFVRAWLAL